MFSLRFSEFSCRITHNFTTISRLHVETRLLMSKWKWDESRCRHNEDESQFSPGCPACSRKDSVIHSRRYASRTRRGSTHQNQTFSSVELNLVTADLSDLNSGWNPESYNLHILAAGPPCLMRALRLLLCVSAALDWPGPTLRSSLHPTWGSPTSSTSCWRCTTGRASRWRSSGPPT